MIVYFDASALVKRYISELGSTKANLLIAYAQVVATNLITRAEVPATIMQADRMQILHQEDAKRIWHFSDPPFFHDNSSGSA